MRIYLSIALLAALSLVACDKAPPQPPAPRPFVVDGQGVHYILDDPTKGPLGAATLDSIPMHQRGVVRVRHDAWAPTPKSARGAWVVDLLDALPGDALVATWKARRDIVGAQIAQNRAYHAGLDVHFVASEQAVVHPTSNRNKRAIELRKLLPTKPLPPISPLSTDTP